MAHQKGGTNGHSRNQNPRVYYVGTSFYKNARFYIYTKSPLLKYCLSSLPPFLFPDSCRVFNESSPRSSRHDALSTQHTQGCGLQSPRPVTATRLCPGKYVVQCLWGHLGRLRDQLLFPVIPKLIFHAPGVTCRPCTCQSGVITEKLFSKNLSTKRKKWLTYLVARYKDLIKTNALLEKRRPTDRDRHTRRDLAQAPVYYNLAQCGYTPCQHRDFKGAFGLQQKAR
jgi:hypothetical protein